MFLWVGSGLYSRPYIPLRKGVCYSSYPFPPNREGCAAHNTWYCFSAVPLYHKELCPPHLLSDLLIPEPHTSSRRFQSYMSNPEKEDEPFRPASTFKTPLAYSCLTDYPARFWVHLLHYKGGSRLLRDWDHSVSGNNGSIPCSFTWILRREMVSATGAQSKMHLQSHPDWGAQERSYVKTMQILSM